MGFLLVHGAWHGAWAWAQVVAELERLGHDAGAIDLPSRGTSSAPGLANLHRDADAVRAVLDRSGSATILVGHSYGGMVITDAGNHDSVVGLVYLAAFVPRRDESLAEIDHSERSPLSRHILPSADGSVLSLSGPDVADVLYHDCDDLTRARSLRMLGPQSAASFSQAPRQLAWTCRPSCYVVCTEDRALPVHRQRAMARMTARVIEIDAGHSPFLSDPEGLATVLASTVPEEDG